MYKIKGIWNERLSKHIFNIKKQVGRDRKTKNEVEEVIPWIISKFLVQGKDACGWRRRKKWVRKITNTK